MTPEEIDIRVEQIAKDGGTVQDIVSFLLGHSVPLDRATKVATQWVEYCRAESLSSSDKRKLYREEIVRLDQLFLKISEEIYDPSQIGTTMEDWAHCNTLLLMDFWREEYESMTFTTGTRVRRVEPPNMVPGSGSAVYGEIIVNHFRHLLEGRPFQEDYLPAHTPEQKIRLKYVGGLHAVQWYDKDGQKDFITFCRDDQISVETPEP